MECFRHAILFKPHPRTIAFNHPTAASDQQPLNRDPIYCGRDGVSKHRDKCFGLLIIHASYLC